MNIDDMKLAYQAHSSLNVTLNRQSYGPLDLGTVFNSLADLEYYRTEGQLCASVATFPEHPYPYAGQIVSLVDNNLGTVEVYKLVPNYELSVFDKVQLDASIKPGDLPIASTTQLGAIKVGDGLGIAADGTLSAQKLTVDQKVEGNETSENPASTKAVYDWSLSTLDTAAATAQGKVDALETSLTGSYLPTNYLSVGVANSPSASDKLMKETEVVAKINALDAALSTLTAAETLKSIKEVDGIIQIEKQDIQIDKSQVNDLTSDLGTINTKIAGLQAVSADHETRITTNTSDIAGLKQMSADLDTAIKAEEARATAAEGVLSAAAEGISATLGVVSSDYLKAADKTELQNSINTKLASEDFAKLSNDIGLSAASPANMVVTKKDIADLAGAMHFKGATANDWAPDAEGTNVPVPPYAEGTLSSQLSAGDIVIVPNTAKEFVWGGEKWIELGDEKLYATKAALAQEVTDRQTGDTNTLASAKTYADGLSTALSTDYTAKIKTVSDNLDSEITARAAADESLQSQVTTISTTYALSADVTAISAGLAAVDTAISNALTGEVSRAESAEQYLSSAIGNKVFVDGTKAESLSVLHDSSDSYHQKVIAGTVLSNELYVLSNDFVNAYGEQIKNVAAPTDANDATTKTYVDTLTAELQSQAAAVDARVTELSTYTHALSVSQLVWDIDVINCGAAS